MISKVIGTCVAGAAVAGTMYWNHWSARHGDVVAPTPDTSDEVTETSPSPSPFPTPTPVTDLKWGAYVGWQEGALAQFESLVGKPVDMVADFVHWGNERDFPMQYAEIARDQEKVLVIYWEVKDYNFEGPNDPRFSYDAILAGNWDSYIDQFAADAAVYDGPVILLPFNEMNDNVSPWSGTQNGNSPEKHILAFRYLRDRFRTVAPNVKFGWAVNSLSVPDEPGNKIEEYYPGSEYVDYVGVDGFNFGDPWQSFDEVFAPALSVLVQYQKPIYLFSMGSRDGSQKAEWIREGLGQAVHHYPVSGWIWFNENKSENGEYDWRVNSDPASLNAFREVIPE